MKESASGATNHLEYLERDLRVLMAKNQELSSHLEQCILQSELEIKKILQGFLDILDDLDSKVKKSRTKLDSGDKKAQKILNRLRTVQRKFRKTLGDFGVVAVKSKEGQPVEPERHIVVETKKGLEGKNRTISKEIRKGYTWQGKMLRPAEVRAVISEEKGLD